MIQEIKQTFIRIENLQTNLVKLNRFKRLDQDLKYWFLSKMGFFKNSLTKVHVHTARMPACAARSVHRPAGTGSRACNARSQPACCEGQNDSPALPKGILTGMDLLAPEPGPVPVDGHTVGIGACQRGNGPSGGLCGTLCLPGRKWKINERKGEIFRHLRLQMALTCQRSGRYSQFIYHSTPWILRNILIYRS